jgi:hypothetical protein
MRFVIQRWEQIAHLSIKGFVPTPTAKSYRVALPRLSALAGIWTLICVLAGLRNPSR